MQACHDNNNNKRVTARFGSFHKDCLHGIVIAAAIDIGMISIPRHAIGATSANLGQRTEPHHHEAIPVHARSSARGGCCRPFVSKDSLPVYCEPIDRDYIINPSAGRPTYGPSSSAMSSQPFRPSSQETLTCVSSQSHKPVLPRRKPFCVEIPITPLQVRHATLPPAWRMQECKLSAGRCRWPEV